MKVLYLLNSFPVATEGYVRTEIDYLTKAGVDVAVWARQRARYEFDTDVPLTVGEDPKPAMRNFEPDVVHVHFLSAAPSFLPAAGELQVPMTVRGHSVDHTELRVDRLVRSPGIRRIFLFPHFAERFDAAKIVPLPVSYDPGRFAPEPDKDWNLVYRAAAGRPGKDLEGFIRVAGRVKEKKEGAHMSFVLFMNSASKGWELWNRDLEKLNRKLGEPVSIFYDANQEQILAVASLAGICLRSHDPGLHPYGHPVSIAEAMGTGSVIVAKDCPEARTFVGAAGIYYHTDEDAAKAVLAVSRWSQKEKHQAVGRSLERARAFAAPNVLPRLVEEWESILEGARA